MNIGVFCASSNHIDDAYNKCARKLGVEIAAREWKLVYGGTSCGLMREVANTVLQQNGFALGIIPQCIYDKGVAAERVSELIVTEDMMQRKAMLRQQSDAFIALPGGWGTMEEITEVITLKQLGQHNKPIVFINTLGFYDLFFQFIADIGERGFVSSSYSNIFTTVATPEEAIQYIENYQVSDIISKYK